MVGWSQDQAFRWSESTGMVGIDPTPEPTVLNSTARSVSADGSVVVGDMYNHAFIWTPDHGMRRLEEVLENDYGLNLTGWTLFTAADISDDGTVIVGYGNNPSGQTEAWRAVLPSLSIIAPKKMELFVAGEDDTIKWKSGGINLVDISFSTDSGKTFNDIEKSYPTNPDYGKYIWSVPEDILSRKCMIRIQDSNNPLNVVSSEVFRIKGYVLTRMDEDSNYEAFDPWDHGWSYFNNLSDMWPQNECWINYIFEDDPVTGNKYPDYIHSHVLPQDFPSWPIFVGGFGQIQTYFYVNLEPAFQLLRAVSVWKSIKRNWGGSCFGMAVSASIAFCHPNELKTYYPTIGDISDIYLLELNPDRRDMINEMFTRQFSPISIFHHKSHYDDGPNMMLDTLKKVLLDSNETNNHQIIAFFNLQTETGRKISGGHSILPYKIEFDKNNSNYATILLYDPNNPGFSAKINIDKEDSLWWYPQEPYASGTDGIYLESPSKDYLIYTILPSPLINKNLIESNLESVNVQQFFQIYNPSEGNIAIFNSHGDSIGFADSTVFEEMQGAYSIIPITGSYHPPLGYSVPSDSYAIRLNAFADSTVYLSIFADSFIYSYGRFDATENQIDQLSYKSNFSLKTDDSQDKSIHITSLIVKDSVENLFDLSKIVLLKNDSMAIKVLDLSNLRVANIGASKTYQLKLIQTHSNGLNTFEHDVVSLESNSVQKIIPLWDSLYTQPVKILIDIDNDGDYDDSMYVQNQITGIKNKDLFNLPKRYHLALNYPNPFNSSTTIEFALPKISEVTLKIYNILGEEVATLVSDKLSAGTYSYEWDASRPAGMASGVYLYRLEAGDFVETRKMMLIQ